MEQYSDQEVNPHHSSLSCPVVVQLSLSPQERVRIARATVREELEQNQRALLQRLFPDVTVDASSFATWLDQFETQAQLTAENTKNQVHVHVYIHVYCTHLVGG